MMCLTMKVQIILSVEDDLAVVALECRFSLLGLVIGRHVTEEMTVLSEFNTTELAGVYVASIVLFLSEFLLFSIRGSGYPDPRAGSDWFLIHHEAVPELINERYCGHVYC